jgi:hypothetical protein
MEGLIARVGMHDGLVPVKHGVEASIRILGFGMDRRATMTATITAIRDRIDIQD